MRGVSICRHRAAGHARRNPAKGGYRWGEGGVPENPPGPIAAAAWHRVASALGPLQSTERVLGSNFGHVMVFRCSGPRFRGFWAWSSTRRLCVWIPPRRSGDQSGRRCPQLWPAPLQSNAAGTRFPAGSVGACCTCIERGDHIAVSPASDLLDDQTGSRNSVPQRGSVSGQVPVSPGLQLRLGKRNIKQPPARRSGATGLAAGVGGRFRGRLGLRRIAAQ